MNDPDSARNNPATSFETYRDLSHPIETGMPVFPGDPSVTLSPAATIDADGYSVHEVQCGSHSGTHIDAPSHTEPDGAVLAERPIEEYVFSARLVDPTPVESREQIDASSLPERTDLEAVDLVVLRTGWDTYWKTDQYLDHPFLSPEAALELRKAHTGVAIDALNPDPTPTENADDAEPSGFPVHHTLLGADLPILENLTNLGGLPDAFTLFAFPLPLAESDGAPVRAVAAIG